MPLVSHAFLTSASKISSLSLSILCAGIAIVATIAETISRAIFVASTSPPVGTMLKGLRFIWQFSLKAMYSPSTSWHSFSKLLPRSRTNTREPVPNWLMIRSCMKTDLPEPDGPITTALRFPSPSKGSHVLIWPRRPVITMPVEEFPHHSPIRGINAPVSLVIVVRIDRKFLRPLACTVSSPHAIGNEAKRSGKCMKSFACSLNPFFWKSDINVDS